MHIDSVVQGLNSIRRAAVHRIAIGLCLLAGITAATPSPVFGEGRADFGPILPDVRSGFVLVDGVYLPPPYAIELIRGALHINGEVLTADDLDLTEFESSEEDQLGVPSSEREKGKRRSRRSVAIDPIDPIDQLWDAARATACMDGVVVLAKGERPLLLEHSRSGHELLVALMRNANNHPKNFVAFEPPDELTSPEDRQAWERVVSDFRPTPEFLVRAGEYVAEILAANASSERIVKASLWADSISYPLTLFAMIVVVVAFGHLLSNKPRLEEERPGVGVSPETRRVVLRSLLIFGLLSMVDLIWTLTAHATGAMREMNPLGNDFIDDPIRLVMFKVIAVSLTIGLLYSLHRRPIAQVASWWSCLVLTLLTARWLTFHSMFM